MRCTMVPYEHSALRRLSPMHTALSQVKNSRHECSLGMYRTPIEIEESFSFVHGFHFALNSLFCMSHHVQECSDTCVKLRVMAYFSHEFLLRVQQPEHREDSVRMRYLALARFLVCHMCSYYLKSQTVARSRFSF